MNSSRNASQDPFTVRSPADLARAITLTDAAGSLGTTHLLRAVRDGRISLLVMAAAGMLSTSNSAFKTWARAISRHPAIALIGDDSGLDQGPAGWPIAERVVAWSRAVIIHASGAEIPHYESAIVAAKLVGRVCFIECSTATAQAWVRLVAAAKHCPHTLVVRPQNGGEHPVPLDRSVLQ